MAGRLLLVRSTVVSQLDWVLEIVGVFSRSGYEQPQEAIYPTPRVAFVNAFKIEQCLSKGEKGTRALQGRL